MTDRAPGAPVRAEYDERVPHAGNPAQSTESAPGHGHGHGHGHSPVPVSKRIRSILAIALIPFALASLVGVVWLYPFGHQPDGGPAPGFGRNPIDGVVIAAVEGSCNLREPAGGSERGGCDRLKIRLDGGPARGSTIEQAVPNEPATPEFAAGDAVVLSFSGTAPREATSYRIVDFQRGGWMLVLAGLFATAVLLLGRLRGLASLLALVFAFAVLAWFVFPAILAGRDPLMVAVVGSGLIMFAVLYFTHGFSARTSTAVLGTLASLGLIGLLSSVFSALTRLTGLDESTSTLIAAVGHEMDARGLLLAGVVIGALGVLDDVTVTQTSAVWELRRANPRLRARELYSAGLRIGRDHVSSSVNTLVLAYAGAALPLLLTYTLSGNPLSDILTTQDVAQEAVRTLVGSIGLIAAVPITTAIAAVLAVRDEGAVGSGDAAAPEESATRHSVVRSATEGASIGAKRPTIGGIRPPVLPIIDGRRSDR